MNKIVCWTVLGLSLSCGGQEAINRETENQQERIQTEDTAPEGDPVAVLDIDQGTIVVGLLPELAPRTVANFINLAELGFYNRTSFHRVLPGRMIQGGDPNSKDNNPYNDGQGNTGEFLLAEFSSHKFDRGTVAMARQAQDPDSASCQFFIVLRRIPEWDGEYTVFGEVIEGIEIAEGISRVPVSSDPRLKNRPVSNIRISGIEIEYR